MTPGAIRVVMVSPYREDFQAWCDVCYASGHWSALGLVPTVVVADEIAGVTHPGKAPTGWHRLLSQGMEWGISVIAITQSPTESDKTAMRNASVIRSFALRLPTDCDAMARYIGCEAAELATLAPLHYIERDMSSGAVVRGSVGA